MRTNRRAEGGPTTRYSNSLPRARQFLAVLTDSIKTLFESESTVSPPRRASLRGFRTTAPARDGYRPSAGRSKPCAGEPSAAPPAAGATTPEKMAGESEISARPARLAADEDVEGPRAAAGRVRRAGGLPG